MSALALGQRVKITHSLFNGARAPRITLTLEGGVTAYGINPEQPTYELTIDPASPDWSRGLRRVWFSAGQVVTP